LMHIPTSLVMLVSLGKPLHGWWTLMHIPTSLVTLVSLGKPLFASCLIYTTTNPATFVLPGGPLHRLWTHMQAPPSLVLLASLGSRTHYYKSCNHLCFLVIPGVGNEYQQTFMRIPTSTIAEIGWNVSFLRSAQVYPLYTSLNSEPGIRGTQS
jgi:hypothetical protein